MTPHTVWTKTKTCNGGRKGCLGTFAVTATTRGQKWCGVCGPDIKARAALLAAKELAKRRATR